MDKLLINKLFFNIKNLGFAVDSIRFKSKNNDIFCGNNSVVNIHSSAKTFTSIALGIAMKYYSIDLNDSIIKYFPEYEKSAYFGTEKIRIIDLLHMQAGKKLQSLLQDSGNALWNEDWLAWFFEAPLNCFPGTEYYYSSHCCYVIGRLIEKLSGQDINLFLEKELWCPLNIETPYWSKCPNGFSNCAGNLMLSCRDLSKLGDILLNKGKYKNYQVCSSDYISRMVNEIVPSKDPFDWDDIECRNGYGFFIWKCSSPETYCSWGAGGTFCVVNYEKEYVVTITSIRNDINWRYFNDHLILKEIKNLIG